MKGMRNMIGGSNGCVFTIYKVPGEMGYFFAVFCPILKDLREKRH